MQKNKRKYLDIKTMENEALCLVVINTTNNKKNE